jgi:hypothetical protein
VGQRHGDACHRRCAGTSSSTILAETLRLDDAEIADLFDHGKVYGPAEALAA